MYIIGELFIIVVCCGVVYDVYASYSCITFFGLTRARSSCEAGTSLGFYYRSYVRRIDVGKGLGQIPQ